MPLPLPLPYSYPTHAHPHPHPNAVLHPVVIYLPSYYSLSATDRRVLIASPRRHTLVELGRMTRRLAWVRLQTAAWWPQPL
jgi:hypothetical protein